MSPFPPPVPPPPGPPPPPALEPPPVPPSPPGRVVVELQPAPATTIAKIASAPAYDAVRDDMPHLATEARPKGERRGIEAEGRVDSRDMRGGLASCASIL